MSLNPTQPTTVAKKIRPNPWIDPTHVHLCVYVRPSQHYSRHSRPTYSGNLWATSVAIQQCLTVSPSLSPHRFCRATLCLCDIRPSVRPSVCHTPVLRPTKSNVAQSMPFGSEIICVTVHWVQTTPVGIRRKHVGAWRYGWVHRCKKTFLRIYFGHVFKMFF